MPPPLLGQVWISLYSIYFSLGLGLAYLLALQLPTVGPFLVMRLAILDLACLPTEGTINSVY